jgi:ketol-acid reductoisomerase
MTRGPRLIDESVRERMQSLLKDIQSGEFAKEWILENRANRPVFRALANQDESHLIEQVGRQLRAMMSWVKSDVAQKTEQSVDQTVAARMQNLEVRE